MYWNPLWEISILANFRPMESSVSFYTVVVFGIDKDLLFNSARSRTLCTITSYPKMNL